MKSSIFWNKTRCSPLKVNRRFRETNRLHLKGEALLATCFKLVSYWAYSSIVKIEATCSSGTLVDFQQTTQRCMPENRTSM
jgi:hypothetical protein